MMSFLEIPLIHQKTVLSNIKKREGLKSVISNSKAYLLGRKWTQEKVGKASDETINKTYAEIQAARTERKG